MADRQIQFSPAMVRALLEGRKTQTRRVLDLWCDEPPALVHNGRIIAYDDGDREYRWPRTNAVGDRLYVREAWRTGLAYEDLSPCEMGGEEQVLFEADGATERWTKNSSEPGRLRQGRHMPRWARRITLIVADVRVQRLQDISEEDAIAEGIRRFTYGELAAAGRQHIANGPTNASWELFHHLDAMAGENDCLWATARDAYHELWDDLNAGRADGAYVWARNPWVVAVSFTVHQRNIDAMEQP